MEQYKSQRPRCSVWRKLQWIFIGLLLFVGLALSGWGIYKYKTELQEFEIVDNLGGNIFPSALLSTAATDARLFQPVDTPFVGTVGPGPALRFESPRAGCRVRVVVEGSPFYRASVSEFVLPRAGVHYIIYPDMIWDYTALRNVDMATPVSMSVRLELPGQSTARSVRTYSVRGINECLLGYLSRKGKYHATSKLFAAYVNEENPQIDGILREALNTRIVNRFLGYQSNRPDAVDNQVYALWYVLQRRGFRYSSVSNSSLSSNVVFSQRVRTFEDALSSQQVNCVDGSVLFASLLRAINIDPVLVRLPGHMFVGYYTNKQHTDIQFLETKMIGGVNLDDFFPDEKLDSTTVGKSQKEVSRLTFEKSKEYAKKKYAEHKSNFGTDKQGYMFLEISRAVRRQIQPIGK